MSDQRHFCSNSIRANNSWRRQFIITLANNPFCAEVVQTYFHQYRQLSMVNVPRASCFPCCRDPQFGLQPNGAAADNGRNGRKSSAYVRR